MPDFKDWYSGLPIFTKYWLSSTVVLSLLGRFGLVNPWYFVLAYEPIIKKFQFWRPLTAALFYPIGPSTGFHFLINCYFLYNYSLRLETGIFAGRPADYCFMLLFCWICSVIIGLFANLQLLMDPLVLSVLYVWCQLNKDVEVQFWFGTRFKAMYLPWVLLAFNLVMSGGGVMELVGILIGHLYFFLVFKYPQEFGGPQLISTPSILKRFFPDAVRGMGASRGGATGGAGGGGGGVFGGHAWGRGRPLNG